MSALPHHVTAAELLSAALAACNCAEPNCGLTLQSQCHPSAGLEVKLFKATGALQFDCAACGRHITTLHASREACEVARQRPS